MNQQAKFGVRINPMHHLSLLLTLYLLLATELPDPRLEGNWYCLKDNELYTATFNPDASFSLDAMGLKETLEQLQSVGIEFTTSYTCTRGNPNRIKLILEATYDGRVRREVLNGIYDFPDAATLRLDFRPDSLPLLETFSPMALTFTNDINSLEELFPVPDDQGNYIFSHEKDGVLRRDTITPNHRAFYKIDSVYRAVVIKD